MSAVEDVMLKCFSCGERVTAIPYREDKHNAQNLVLYLAIPDGWRGSYGASGKGSFVTCPACTKKQIRMDDVDRCVDVGGFVND